MGDHQSLDDPSWVLTPIDDWHQDHSYQFTPTKQPLPADIPSATASSNPSSTASSSASSFQEVSPLPVDFTEYSPPVDRVLSPSPISETSCHEARYVCPNSHEEFHWYFAIGSMINPTSLSLRKLAPCESYPGILRGWRLVFRGDCGMASILPADSNLPSMHNHSQPRDDFHGVLHRLCKEQMMKLDVIESSYERLEVYVECYDGKLQKATVYKMAEEKLDPSKPDALPSERYLDIISRGCIHFGISPEYIAWLRAHQCVKRKKPSEYRKIPIHELHQSGLKHLQITAEELTKFDGRLIEEGEVITEEDQSQLLQYCQLPNPSPEIPAASASPSLDSCSPSCTPALPSPSPDPIPPQRFYPLRIAVNKKILEWIGDLRQPLLANTYEFMRFNFGGTDLTHSYTCVFFEPLYPIVASYKDMSLEHRAMVEDIFYEKCFNPNVSMREWKLVGFLNNEEQKSSQQAGRNKLRQNRMGMVQQGEQATTGDLEPDFESNMFLSLSMEDHSGASSTCFAFCCAGAQPFHAQRIREHQKHAAGKYNGSGSAHHSTHQHETQGALRTRKHLERDRKRRHSIGNVGLHQAAAMKAEAMTANAPDATSSTATSTSASSSANSDGVVSSSTSSQTCGIHPHPHLHDGRSSAPTRHHRAYTICNGVLAASHTSPLPTSASKPNMSIFCLSPMNRQRTGSMDDMNLSLGSPIPNGLSSPSYPDCPLPTPCMTRNTSQL